MSLYPLVETMTAPVADRLVRAARIRQPLRRLAWRNAVQDAINNLSSCGESRHAKVTLKREGSARLECKDHSGVVTHTQLAGVAPGLLNNFRPVQTRAQDSLATLTCADAAPKESQGV